MIKVYYKKYGTNYVTIQDFYSFEHVEQFMNTYDGVTLEVIKIERW